MKRFLAVAVMLCVAATFSSADKCPQKCDKPANDITEMVFILDRSGSMGGLESDTIGGFNSMIKEQKGKKGEAYVTTILFDNKVETLHNRLPIAKVKPITEKDYFVRGSTALLDAVGSAVAKVDAARKDMAKKDIPAHTVFVITTDGLENASKEYTTKAVKSLIEKHKKLGWEFVFIGANMDAVEAAGRIGIDRGNAVNYVNDGAGIGNVYKGVSKKLEATRNGDADSPECREDIDNDYNNRGK